MVDAFEAIRTRKTIRDFAEAEVSREIIKRVIEAGLTAPSNDHLRQWEFIVLKDKKRQMELAQIIKAPQTKQGSRRIVSSMGLSDPLQREMYLNAIPKQQSMVCNAGCVIVPTFHWGNPLGDGVNISSLNCFASIWCCIENLLIAASAEGIYGVPRIPIDREEEHRIRELLGIPDNYLIPCCLSLGYPRKDTERERQIDYHIESRIRNNRW